LRSTLSRRLSDGFENIVPDDDFIDITASTEYVALDFVEAFNYADE
jgi:hypothetical protein